MVFVGGNGLWKVTAHIPGVRPSHVVKKLSSMAQHQVRVLGGGRGSIKILYTLVIFLCARMMLVADCGVFMALATLVNGGTTRGSGAVLGRYSSTVQRPDGACAPSRMHFPFRVMCTSVL